MNMGTKKIELKIISSNIPLPNLAFEHGFAVFRLLCQC